MRVGILGPGVIGSILGGKLARAGHDVTLIGRGSRLMQLKKDGLNLRAAGADEILAPKVRVQGQLGQGPGFDWLIVCVRAHAANAALTAVADQDRSTNVLTMINHARGTNVWTDIVGERLALGFPGLSGTFDEDNAVEYRVAPRLIQPSTVGEVSKSARGGISDRLTLLAGVLNQAGIPTVIRPNIEDWLRSHVAWIHILGLAMECAGGDIDRLRDNKRLLTDLLLALREALAVVEASGSRLTPSGLNWLQRAPLVVLRMAAIVALKRPEVEAAFAEASVGQRLEMREMLRQVQELAEVSSTPMPVHSRLSSGLTFCGAPGSRR